MEFRSSQYINWNAVYLDVTNFQVTTSEVNGTYQESQTFRVGRLFKMVRLERFMKATMIY